MLNQGVNIGHSSRAIYDKCAYDDYLTESVGPVLYKMNPNQINNCEACLSTLGPRTSNGPYSYGVSTIMGHKTAPSQKLVDVESILSNRNVIASKCKDGKVNEINVTKFKLQHARTCNEFLNPLATHLTNPPQNYRGMSINRFYNLPTNPQKPIFYDFAINTKLEAKDNYLEYKPKFIDNKSSLPREIKGNNKTCYYTCNNKMQ